MSTLFALFLPDQILPLLLPIAAILLMLGFRTAAGGLVVMLLVLVLAGPFIEAAVGAAPPLVGVLILFALAGVVVRAVASMFLGQAAADHTVGILAADAIRGMIHLLFLPLRLLARALAAAVRR